MSIIGTTINWGEDQPVELPPEDRRRHVYLIGQTGTGKTTLLRNLILQDIHEGRGVGFRPVGSHPPRACARGSRACLTPRRRSDLSPGPRSAPAQPLRHGHSQAREGERVDAGPLGRRAEPGSRKFGSRGGFARTCSPPCYSRPLHVIGILHPEALHAIRVVAGASTRPGHDPG
jgi:hypothetical protein